MTPSRQNEKRRDDAMVLANQTDIDYLAGRIERAYLLRRPQWNPGCSAPGVWAAAAANLLQAHRDHPTVPIDPELYVAAQANGPTLADPWTDLVQSLAVERYRRRVRKIVCSLRRELRGEVNWATRQVDAGQSLVTLLLSKCRSLSPLGRFIIAQRAGQGELADQFRAGARRQHAMCPLYRQASRALLPVELYPVGDFEKQEESGVCSREPDTHVSWN